MATCRALVQATAMDSPSWTILWKLKVPAKLIFFFLLESYPWNSTVEIDRC
jgi:hypothetical protein